MVGYGVPEVVVLRGVGVLQRDVADDAERNEVDAIDVARLGNGCRLHIDGYGFGEVGHDGAHLVARIDKPVAGDYKARMYARLALDVSIHQSAVKLL